MVKTLLVVVSKIHALLKVVGGCLMEVTQAPRFSQMNEENEVDQTASPAQLTKHFSKADQKE